MTIPSASRVAPASSGAQPRQGGGIRPASTGVSPRAMPSAHGAAQGAQPPRAPGGVVGYQAVRATHERQTQEEHRRMAENTFTPIRFYLPAPGPQRTPADCEASIIILDHEPSFAVFEHQFPDPRTGRFGRGSYTQLCLSGESHCPACDVDQRDPYYALFLSIIDQRPYVNRQGQTVPFSKKLLVIKNRNQDYFFRLFERHGTLRGMQLLMVRTDRRGANHGNPEFIELHPEAAIMESFSHPRRMSQDGQRVVMEENEMCFPYDYSTICPKPDYNEMVARYGVQPAAGSPADYANTWGGMSAGGAPAHLGPNGTANTLRNTIGAASSAGRQRPMQGDDVDMDVGYDDGQDQDQDRGHATVQDQSQDQVQSPRVRQRVPQRGSQSQVPQHDGQGVTDPDEIPF